jgi:hypothetical protein
MKTQRAPFTLAEYCPLPVTHQARPHVPAGSVDIRKTFESYGWKPTQKHEKPKQNR